MIRNASVPQKNKLFSLISLSYAIQGSRWNNDDRGRTSKKYPTWMVQHKRRNDYRRIFKGRLWVKVPKKGGIGMKAQIPL